MSPKIRDPFRIDREAYMPNLTDDLLFLIKRSIYRIHNLLGGNSSASELDINNGIGELSLELRRNMTNLGAVFRLRRTLSMYTELSNSEIYCEAVKFKFLQLIKAGHADSAYELYEECGDGIDFANEIKEGFFHLCTEPMPAVHFTRIKGGVRSEELMSPEHWDVYPTLNTYRFFKKHIDFRQVCEEALVHLRKNGHHDDALVLYNAFKDKLQLSSSEE